MNVWMRQPAIVTRSVLILPDHLNANPRQVKRFHRSCPKRKNNHVLQDLEDFMINVLVGEFYSYKILIISYFYL